MKKYLVYIVGAMMTFSMLTGCGGASDTAQNESDIYMSQFGEYENSDQQALHGLSEDSDAADALSMTSNGEKIFEETEYDGKPKETPKESDKAESDNESDKKQEKTTETKKTIKKAKKTVTNPAPEVNPILVADPLAPVVVTPEANQIVPATPEATQNVPATPEATQSADQSLMAQTIANPTENNSSSGSSGSSSDTGSGVSQTCDDGGGTDTDNSSSSSTVESFFE